MWVCHDEREVWVYGFVMSRTERVGFCHEEKRECGFLSRGEPREWVSHEERELWVSVIRRP